jgi:hypothetical protein
LPLTAQRAVSGLLFSKFFNKELKCCYYNLSATNKKQVNLNEGLPKAPPLKGFGEALLSKELNVEECPSLRSG